MRILVALLLIFQSSMAGAAESKKANVNSVVRIAPSEFDVPISRGFMISVESYDKESQTYSIEILKESGVGPNIAMPGDLADSISALNIKEMNEHPERVVGNTYKLDKELRLISEKGVEIRKKLLKKKK